MMLDWSQGCVTELAGELEPKDTENSRNSSPKNTSCLQTLLQSEWAVPWKPPGVSVFCTPKGTGEQFGHH